MRETHALWREFHGCTLEADENDRFLQPRCDIYPDKCIFELIDQRSMNHTALETNDEANPNRNSARRRKTNHIFHIGSRANDQSSFEVGFLSTFLRINSNQVQEFPNTFQHVIDIQPHVTTRIIIEQNSVFVFVRQGRT